MPTHEVISIIDGEPTFKTPINEILAAVKEEMLKCEHGEVFEYKRLSHIKYITDRQRRWYKGVCLRDLVKNDENGETKGWWDTEVKKHCNGLALLKKEIFFIDDGSGGRIGIGRLTTKGVGKRCMTAFIEEILSKSMARGWNIGSPDPDLRKE